MALWGQIALSVTGRLHWHSAVPWFHCFPFVRAQHRNGSVDPFIHSDSFLSICIIYKQYNRSISSITIPIHTSVGRRFLRGARAFRHHVTPMQQTTLMLRPQSHEESTELYLAALALAEEEWTGFSTMDFFPHSGASGCKSLYRVAGGVVEGGPLCKRGQLFPLTTEWGYCGYMNQVW